MSQQIGTASPLATIPDLQAEVVSKRIYRQKVAGAASETCTSQLIHGTEKFFAPGLVEMHKSHGLIENSDLACYFVKDCVVAGAGQVWLDDRLITASEIVPSYVSNMFELEAGGSAQLRAAATRPLRTIDGPCVIALGHGIRVYGHFLVEMLFRILTARHALQGSSSPFKILLSNAAPGWLLTILSDYLHIGPVDIEFFDPKIERVQLREAIVPALIHHDERFHPFANTLLSNAIDSLKIPVNAMPKRRIFVRRGRFHNPHAPHRICLNEDELVEIAATRLGFDPVTPESMSWAEQIGLFAQASIIVGQAGSGLHNAIFSGPGTRMGSIGFLSMMQSGISALRGHHAAFLTEGFRLAGDFHVDPRLFEQFLSIVCA